MPAQPFKISTDNTIGMKLINRLKIFGFLLILLNMGFGLSAHRLEAESYSALFTEEILTVTKERDGLLPGTLRTALIQASGIRAQNSFTIVKIVFSPQVRRLQITKGPLPDWEGSLLTIDCSIPDGRGIIEYVAREDDAGEDPSQEPSVLTLRSNGNLIRNCHLTGATGAGIKIFGNHNIIEHSALGFHQEVPETAAPPSALYQVPKTNGKAGVYLGPGANENQIQHNDIVANTYHGVFLDRGVGTANRIEFNYFVKNSGESIKAVQGTPVTPSPTLQNIRQEGDRFIISGTASPRSEIQIYMTGKTKDEVGMLVVQAKGPSPMERGHFEIETKSKGFVLGETQLVAQSHGFNLNSSEFSSPILVGSPKTPVEDPASDVRENEADNTEAPIIEEGEGPEEAEVEVDEGHPELPQPRIKDTRYHPNVTNPDERPDQPAGQGSQVGTQVGTRFPTSGESSTVINLNGQGDGGGQPDTGSNQQNDVNSMGI